MARPSGDFENALLGRVCALDVTPSGCYIDAVLPDLSIHAFRYHGGR